MRTSKAAWSLAGFVAGGAGLATSYLTANLMNIREAPVVAVAELVIRETPGGVARSAIDVLGHKDKPVLVVSILVILAVLFALAGWLARRRWWASVLVFAVIAGFGVFAIMSKDASAASDLFPIVVGLVTWLLVLFVLGERLRRLEALPDDAEPTEDDPGHRSPRTRRPAAAAS